MPQYTYQVRDAGGGTSAGVVSAASATEASRTLRSEGNIILDLHERAASAGASRGGDASRKRAKRDHVIFFANQLAVMVDTGVSLPDALDGIAEQAESDTFRSVLEDLSDEVKSGVDFSTALAKYPRIFGRLFVAMVKASEASGTMGKMLQRISKHLEQQRQILKRVKGAIMYPAGMLGFCVLVVVCMMTFVLPRFERIYAGRKAALPVPTRVLLGISGALTNQWALILGALGIIVVGGYLFFRGPDGRILLDRMRIKAPVVGKIYQQACMARSLRTLSTMVSTGVSMLESMEITAEVSGNILYTRIWRDLGEKLREGASLSEEMTHHELVPACVCQMVGAGEKTGKLSAVLDRVAAFCEEDLDTTIRGATSLIEPAMIIIMGLVVGGIAMALLLPIFSLSKVVSS